MAKLSSPGAFERLPHRSDTAVSCSYIGVREKAAEAFPLSVGGTEERRVVLAVAQRAEIFLPR